MQVVPSVGQIWNRFWWHLLVVKFWTNTSGTTYNWPNLKPMQVAFYLAGEITQDKESIPWVRCASGNVYRNSRTIVLETFGGETFSVADILVLVRIQQSFLWVLGIQFVMCLENLKFEPEWRENVRSSPSYHNPATELSGLGENRPLQHLTRFTDFHRINFSKCENCLI